MTRVKPYIPHPRSLEILPEIRIAKMWASLIEGFTGLYNMRNP